MPEKIVRRIDHLLVRGTDEQHTALYQRLTETFRLPVAWQATNYAGFTSTGIFLGNLTLNLMQMNPPRKLPRALLYGIGFEAHEDATQALPRVGLTYFPTRVMQPADPTAEAWTSLLIGRMMGTNLWMEGFYGRRRFSRDAALLDQPSRYANPFVFDRVHHDGIIYTVKYAPAFRDVKAEQQRNTAALQQVNGGSLGLVRVKEVVVQTPQLAQARERWHKLLQGRAREDVWQLNDSAWLRLQIGARQRIAGMVWQVQNLKRAAEFLTSANIAFTPEDKTLKVAQDALFGLNVRLIEDK